MALLLSRVIKCVSQKKYLTSITISSQFYNLKKEKNSRHYCKKLANTGYNHNILKRPGQLSFKDGVIKKVKTYVYYGGIIGLVGFGIYVVYLLLAELLFDKNPSHIYQEAFKICQQNPTVIEILGGSIHRYIDEQRLDKRYHMSHRYFKLDDETFLKMEFYLKGDKLRGTACLEVTIDSNGEHEYVYFYIKVNDLKKTIIVLEDHRGIEEYKNSDFSHA